MIHGSSQARTARSASGQQSRGRRSAAVLLIFPPPRLQRGSRGGGGRRRLWRRIAVLLRRCRGEREALLTVVVPTEGEGTADQGPVPPDRQVGAHLVLAPAQGVLRLLVALLHPHAQAIEADHL